MNRIAIVGGTAVLPDELVENATIVCHAGRIESISAKAASPAGVPVIDASGKYITPGFLDLHVHGGAGADFMDGTLEAVRTACQAHLWHGTTTIFPTTTTGSPEQIMAMLDSCRALSREVESRIEATAAGNLGVRVSQPRIPGIHLYGPFFAADKVGCHSLDGRRTPSEAEYAAYFETEFIRIATCAAELEGAQAFYQTARRSDCLITCGHSNASWAEMQAAFDSGMRHVDHFWCAMSSVPSLRQRFDVPMQASMAEFVLMNREMSTEVIADGWHLSPELLEFAYRMIGPNRLCLVTDCNRALEMPPGDYRFGNAHDGSWFRSDGRVGWAPDGKSLASSVVGMDDMVRHMFRSSNASLPEVIRMATLTPAERTGLDQEVGSLRVGRCADLLILDEGLHIQQIVLSGHLLDHS